MKFFFEDYILKSIKDGFMENNVCSEYFALSLPIERMVSKVEGKCIPI